MKRMVSGSSLARGGLPWPDGRSLEPELALTTCSSRPRSPTLSPVSITSKRSCPCRACTSRSVPVSPFLVLSFDQPRSALPPPLHPLRADQAALRSSPLFLCPCCRWLSSLFSAGVSDARDCEPCRVRWPRRARRRRPTGEGGRHVGREPVRTGESLHLCSFTRSPC